jgi:hypothetical protein
MVSSLMTIVTFGMDKRTLSPADVDECTTAKENCDQICTNTDGSFTCSCEDGFRLSIDRHSCVGTCGNYVLLRKMRLPYVNRQE